MVKVQQDLIELSQFKINKKISPGPSNPPVPILHSLTRKARKAVDIRTKVEKQIAKKQKEEQLHELALHARTDRTGICPADNFDDTEALINASKCFEQEYDFKEADRAELRERPVQFQCDEDPFGLSNFLKDVRHGSAGSSALSANRSSSSSFKRSNADDQQERTSEKRRKK
ncbi:unnamed protein product [Rotaria sordida]|uniref:Uncharacterized protein n=1 Tax=Rotaria sordida TaxID=392033 RepID=A0A815KDD4_9BILA|nr:unnamed protein product [Rotaria sordida]